MPFNDNVKETEQLLRQRHSEREGWRRGDKEQGNSGHRQRIANESTDERDARLLQLRATQQQRIANGSTEESLLQLRAAQQQRIAKCIEHCIMVRSLPLAQNAYHHGGLRK